MSEYHDPAEELGDKHKDHHRALWSLREEIEAIDWYQQRTACSPDAALRAILAHNQREEIEHACMLIEWLRRNMDGWEETLRRYLFSDLPITAIEEAAESKTAPSALCIGSLKA